jgi:septal ring factor EnvC (AmiA/AmiB activator)
MKPFEGIKCDGKKETLEQTLDRLENRIHELEFEKEEKAEARDRRHVERVEQRKKEMQKWKGMIYKHRKPSPGTMTLK